MLNIKSSFYHKVLEPSEADCSNEYLSRLAYEYSPKELTPTGACIENARATLEYIGQN